MIRGFILKGLREEGSQSRVFDAVEASSDRPCVIKFGPKAREEALLGLDLNHSSILAPFDCGTDKSEGPFAVYPVANGDPLRPAWLKAGDLVRRRIVLQISEFLAFLHSRGWLYTDFKPEHFYFNDGHLQVIDLGLCTPLSAGATGMKTYSGTYPFISPERMTGRPFDQRSDLYSLGVMILDLFRPLPRPATAPRELVPPGIRLRISKMKGVWKEVLSELAAPEPSQRLASALELRARLLPKRVRNTPLFFDVPGSATIPEPLMERSGVVVVQSPSEINLDETERQITAFAWKRSGRVIRVDLSVHTLKKSFVRTAAAVIGHEEPDLLSAVESLRSHSGDLYLVFRNPQALARGEASLFSFALSSLSESQGFRIFVLTGELTDELTTAGWNIWQPQPYLSQDLSGLVRLVCPSDGISLPADPDRGKTVIPEEVLFGLQKKLDRIPSEWWPSAAWRYRRHASFETLNVREKGMLLKVALCADPGGRIRGSAFQLTGCRPAVKQRLMTRGWIREVADGFLLIVPASDILKRFRGPLIRTAAKKLLIAAKSRGEDTVVYSLSCILNVRSLSASTASRIARQTHETDRDASLEWMWKAFVNGHLPDREWSRELIVYNLHRQRLKRVRRLLGYCMRKQGRTLALADRYLDLLHRQNRIENAAVYAGKLASIAEARGWKPAQKYFIARHAGFLILSNKLADAEIELSRCAAILTPKLERMEGLIFHFRGLLALQKGDVPRAIEESKKAAAMSHRFQTTSIMNLGLAEMLSGNRQAYSQYMEKCLERFMASHDLLRLCFAYNNCGVLLKKIGDLDAARENYSKSIHLSKACRNAYILSAAIDNLATTYALEGRTKAAIEQYRRAISVARKAKLPEREAHSLSNAGLQYAFSGRFRTAISCLRRSLKLREKLGMKLMVADAQEYLGLTFTLLGQARKACEFLEAARGIYGESKIEHKALRARLYSCLANLESGAEVPEIPGDPTSLVEGSLEHGLFNYVRASWLRRTSRLDSLPELNNAELVFRKLPALFWLARTLKEKALYYLEAGNYEKALLSIQAASDIFQRMDARRELKDLSEEPIMKNIPEDFQQKIAEKMPYHVLLMVQEVLKEKDTSRMVDRILTTSLEFTGMERAVLILEQDPPRVFKSTTLDAAAIREIQEISHSAADTASRTAKPFICHDASIEALVKSRPSIVANRITSIACLPLYEGERLLGFLYLDSREGVESLAATETALLEIFASIVAMALRTGLLLEQSAREIDGLKESIGLKNTTPEIVANSRAMLTVLKTVHRLIGADLPVLITGDTGTGKEAIARLLHFEGKRKNGPFVAVNGSAITETLLESELFGHEKGSFTGATSQRKGLFEEAKDGTLFIDEIAEMSLAMQAKLLRVLQEGEYRRVGGSSTLKTNVRVIAATNRHLSELVSQKVFREDLYYRVRGAQVHLPPLRERAEDIVPLALHFLRSSAVAAHKRIRGLRPETYPILRRYSWPGNVRELRNEMERITAMTENDWIVPADFDPQILAMSTAPAFDLNQLPTLRESEKELILQRLKRTGWNIHQTAKSLGITRNGLYGKMTQYSIPRKKPAEI